MKDMIVVGIGGGGTFMARAMADALFIKPVVVNTDMSPRVDPRIIERIIIGSTTCSGEAAVSPERGRRAAEESIEVLRKLVTSAREIIFVAALGGGTGTGALPVLAGLARQNGVPFVCAVTLPFDSERNSRQYAEQGLERLQSEGVTVMVVDHAVAWPDAENRRRYLADVLDDLQQELIRKVAAHLRLPVSLKRVGQ